MRNPQGRKQTETSRGHPLLAATSHGLLQGGAGCRAGLAPTPQQPAPSAYPSATGDTQDEGQRHGEEGERKSRLGFWEMCISGFEAQPESYFPVTTESPLPTISSSNCTRSSTPQSTFPGTGPCRVAPTLHVTSLALPGLRGSRLQGQASCSFGDERWGHRTGTEGAHRRGDGSRKESTVVSRGNGTTTTKMKTS